MNSLDKMIAEENQLLGATRFLSRLIEALPYSEAMKQDIRVIGLGIMFEAATGKDDPTYGEAVLTAINQVSKGIVNG